MMNSGHKGSKKFVHKGPFFHPTSTRVFRGPPLAWTQPLVQHSTGPLKLQDELTCSCLFIFGCCFLNNQRVRGKVYAAIRWALELPIYPPKNNMGFPCTICLRVPNTRPLFFQKSKKKISVFPTFLQIVHGKPMSFFQVI